MTGPIHLGPVALGLAASLMLIQAGLSVALGLGLGRQMLVASVRTVVQLLLMGAILVPVFAAQQPALVALLGGGMILLAAREAVSRTRRSYRGIWGGSALALLIGAGGTTLLATGVLVGVEPWWEPQYLLPLLGMTLGNALTGISLGLDRCLTELDEGRDRVEALLAAGATRWEAARPVAREALRTGLVPMLNAMSAVGLVTIPGMMTGQILGGTDPSLAARYQILVMFLIATATGVGTAIAVGIALLALFDADHRLRLDRLRRKD